MNLLLHGRVFKRTQTQTLVISDRLRHFLCKSAHLALRTIVAIVRLVILVRGLIYTVFSLFQNGLYRGGRFSLAKCKLVSPFESGLLDTPDSLGIQELGSLFLGFYLTQETCFLEVAKKHRQEEIQHD